MNIEEQRTKFESWATGQSMSIARSIVDHPQSKYEYVSNKTESAWRAWLESVQQNEANDEPKRKPIIDRCKLCGLALNDDGTCDDCFLAGMQLGLIGAMERGDELRDRMKDERATDAK